ncbi:dihydrodipicolinate synthase family protein [Amycolatopsis sp. NPDC059657]|uniref:dihydrodipicolinate synthase family protein n=1 Tax=Amycolatopsis sp. NPDC059657 TaxID=3346899 RepID=UPI00366AE09B
MIKLPDADGELTAYEPSTTPSVFVPGGPAVTSRTFFAAPHVIVDPTAGNEPYTPPVLDWEATLKYRHHIWSHGLAVSEALDTAHRGMGLGWLESSELIKRSAAEAHAVGGRIAGTAWTDQLAPGEHTLEQVIRAYEEQIEVIEGAGAQVILMASRELAAVARGPEEYADVYKRLLSQLSQPAIVHWVTAEWDPSLTGYWGSTDIDEEIKTFVSVITDNKDKVDGIKVAPLPGEREIELRRAVPAGIKTYTGDDTNYPEVIAGDDRGHSHAMMGVFDPLAPIVAAAGRKLDAGDVQGFRDLITPTAELSMHLFEGPGMNIRFYKTGFTFLSWLSGTQDHFRMVWGEQAARSVSHLAKAYRLADGLGLFPDPELAAHRLSAFLVTNGVE